MHLKILNNFNKKNHNNKKKNSLMYGPKELPILYMVIESYLILRTIISNIKQKGE